MVNRIRFLLVALALLGGSWLLPAVALADGPQPTAAWAQLRGDGARTGRSTIAGPATPEIAWRFNIGAPIVSGPVIAADGTVYVGTENFRVWALRPDLSLKWTYELFDSGGYAAPTYLMLDIRGQIVLGTANGFVIGLQTDGKQAWRFDTRGAPYGSDQPQAIRSAPGGAANSSRVYVGTDAGLLYELEDGGYAGVRRSEADGAIRAGAAVTPDGSVVWATARALRAGSFDRDKWRMVLDGAAASAPAVGGDSTTYVATDNGSVYAVSTTGELRWRARPGAGQPLRSGPALAADGTLYVSGDEGRLFALDPATGATRWSFATGGALTADPTVAANGLIYLGSNDGRLYVLSPDGRQQSSVALDAPIDRAAVAIGAGGSLYAGTLGGWLYGLKGTVAAPASSGAAGAAAAPSATTPSATAATTAPAPAGFAYVRCGSGRIYTLTPARLLGDYVSSPAGLGAGPILEPSESFTQPSIDAICGPGR